MTFYKGEREREKGFKKGVSGLFFFLDGARDHTV
jgi:hypothetical protein